MLPTQVEGSRLTDAALQGFCRQSGASSRLLLPDGGAAGLIRPPAPYRRFRRCATGPVGHGEPPFVNERSRYLAASPVTADWALCHGPAGPCSRPSCWSGAGYTTAPAREAPGLSSSLVPAFGCRRGVAGAQPSARGSGAALLGSAGCEPSGPGTGHSGVPSWWENRGRGFHPDSGHSRGGTARAGSWHSEQASGAAVPVWAGVAFVVIVSAFPGQMVAGAGNGSRPRLRVVTCGWLPARRRFRVR
jgi:hypothetical protein